MKACFALALLLWQLAPLTALNDQEFGSALESIKARNPRNTVDCAQLTDADSTEDVLDNCDAVASANSYTLKMDSKTDIKLWDKFTSTLKRSKNINYHFINSNVRQIRLLLDEDFVSNEVIITGNNILSTMDIRIGSGGSIQLGKLVITENRRLATVSLSSTNYTGTSITINENVALEVIDFKLSPILAKELTVVRNPELVLIEGADSKVFNKIEKMKIRGNGRLNHLSIHRLKIASWDQLRDSEVQDDIGECSFIEKVTNLRQLHGCITVIGDLVLAHDIHGKFLARLIRVTGNVHLAGPPDVKKDDEDVSHASQEEPQEGLYSFLRGTQIHGILSTDRCDISVIHFDVWHSRPIEKKPENCTEKQVEEPPRQEFDLPRMIIAAIAMLLILSGLISCLVLTIMMAIKRKSLARIEKFRCRKIGPPIFTKKPRPPKEDLDAVLDALSMVVLKENKKEKAEKKEKEAKEKTAKLKGDEKKTTAKEKDRKSKKQEKKPGK